MYLRRIIWGNYGGTQGDNECKVAIVMEFKLKGNKIIIRGSWNKPLGILMRMYRYM
jgi:hypothetical protein